jgi:hypothetical protein
MLDLGLRCLIRDAYFRQLPATFIYGRGEGSFARTSAIVGSVPFLFDRMQALARKMPFVPSFTPESLSRLTCVWS